MQKRDPGKNLKIMRYRLGYTQNEFGKLHGVSQAAISWWETNSYPIPPGMVQRFIKLSRKIGLNYSYDDLRVDE